MGLKEFQRSLKERKDKESTTKIKKDESRKRFRDCGVIFLIKMV